MKKKWLIFYSILILLLMAACIRPGEKAEVAKPKKQAAQEQQSGGLQVHFIDVGQGDATLLVTEEHTMLIDAGDWNSTATIDYLKQQGIEKIDIAVGTHPDSDHIGQLADVINNFDVGEVWMSGNESTSNTFINTLEAIDLAGTDYYEPRSGEIFDLGAMEIEVLYPEKATGKANEESISMKLTYGDVRFVFTGDSGVKEEQNMIDSGMELDAEVLHLGHHGSNTSTGNAFLKAVSPEIAVYSAGEGNSYGHPHAEVLAAVENAGAEVYGTDVNGTVIVQTDGKTYSVSVERNGVAKEGKNRCIDLNAASSSELQEIEGIGSAFAKEIIAERPFRTIDQLTEIKGIGPGKLKNIKEQGLACVGG
ncbi:beta-lactamase superfamily II metal-dependent hydrolase [Planomicrobium soli]|uniref:Beta-lactamase superfamily II metal-dependent hydrolase n=1 Tax=Planomicrobium soli TaxID=1176648 RepID=A0A2P8H2E7_9BACL|nr:MBL fold metallo-hydrolase [Planomicrobium soli]PSL40381.1 beta-lactamase superfamily II metal-dependent hydrolase [Planomicrobium soli]